MSLIDHSGFHIASPRATSKAPVAAPLEKTFPLEGRKGDLFKAVESLANTQPGGPTYPTLAKRLFSSVDAAEQTMAALGKKPTPEEVDRSNLRRLIRATEPLLETYRDCYPPKDFKKAQKEFKTVARAMGQYKDIAVVESEVAAVNGGEVPKDIAQSIKKSRKKLGENFRQAYKHFRKVGLPRAARILRDPRVAGVPDPQKLLTEDRSRLKGSITDHLDKTKKLDLKHRHPETFHEARKSLRSTLNAINVADRTISVDSDALSKATALVDSFGQAQDAHIAETWLREHGFQDQADKLAQRYFQLQSRALDQAADFSLDSLKPHQ